MTACQSTDKSQSFFGTDENITYRCDYDAESGKTIVRWSSFIRNDTIYNITEIKVKFNYFLSGKKVSSEGFYYDILVKYGEIKIINCNFTTNQEIDGIEFNSWDVTSYTNLWDTYKAWRIATIVIASVLAFVYILIIFIEDLELSDVFDFFTEHFYITFLPLFSFFPYLINGFSSGNWSWVPAVIIAGGILSDIILGLLAHFVKFLIEI